MNLTAAQQQREDERKAAAMEAVRLSDHPAVTRYLGWFWNPVALEWHAKVGPNRWLIAKGYDLDNPPQYSPHQLT